MGLICGVGLRTNQRRALDWLLASVGTVRKLLIAASLALALGLAGCGQSSAGKRAEHEFDRGLKYHVAEEMIEEEGFSHSAASEARESAEDNGLSPQEAAQMGAIAKQMGR